MERMNEIEAWIRKAADEPWTLYENRYRADFDAHVNLTLDGKYAEDCGGWTWDPPCGGCDRCIADQIWYYIDQDRQCANRYAKAGFAWIELVEIDFKYRAVSELIRA
jgi:hypothetical protein